jgi:hypothetical protein
VRQAAREAALETFFEHKITRRRHAIAHAASPARAAFQSATPATAMPAIAMAAATAVHAESCVGVLDGHSTAHGLLTTTNSRLLLIL